MALPEKAKNPGGRPAWEPTPSDLATILNASAQGGTHALIARQLGIAKQTLANNAEAMAALEEGREVDKGITLSRGSELMRQNDNLNVALGAVKWRGAVIHGLIEPRGDGTGTGPNAQTREEAAEEAQAAVESARAKLAPYLDAPASLPSLLGTIAEAVKTGNFDGDLEAFQRGVASLTGPAVSFADDDAGDAWGVAPEPEPTTLRHRSVSPEPEPEPTTSRHRDLSPDPIDDTDDDTEAQEAERKRAAVFEAARKLLED